MTDVYTGDDPAILALTDAEIAELEANFPHQVGLTVDQVTVWFESAYFNRHIFDSLDTAPFS